MKTSTLTQLLLYKYRYWVGYGLVIVCGLFFLGWQLSSVAPGLSQSEMISASHHISLTSIKDNPTYPLQAIGQWGVMKLFDVSLLGLRLPSVLIAAGTAFLLYHLFKRWFGKPASLLATAIFLSADWFLFVARSGTGTIELSFWLALCLLSLTKLVEKKQIWAVLTTISLIALLFVPLGPYAAVAVVAATLKIATFRERIRSLNRPLLAGCLGLGILGLAGFIVIGLQGEGVIRSSLGLLHVPSLSQYGNNLYMSVVSLAAFVPWQNPEHGVTGIFLFRFFEIIFALFGVIMLWRTRVNRFNDVVFVLAIVLLLAGGLSNEFRGGAALLVPMMIFITAGLRHFTHRWKRTFPNNPYARIAAFFPLLTLLTLIFGFHYTAYFVLWPHQTSTHSVFAQDFTLAQAELRRSNQSQNCLVITDNVPLQTLLLRDKRSCSLSVASQLPSEIPAATRTLISANLAYRTLLKPETSLRALSASTQQHNDRWVVLQQQ